MHGKHTKIVFDDGNSVKGIRGNILDEDENFVRFRSNVGIEIRVNKKHIHSIREYTGDINENLRNK